MTALIITAPKPTDLQLFIDLANRIGIKAKKVNDRDIIDSGLLNAMQEGRKTKFVSKDVVMKKLKRNGN